MIPNFIKQNSRNIIVAVIIIVVLYLIFKNKNIDKFDVGEVSTILSTSDISKLSDTQKKELKEYYTNLLQTTPLIKNLNKPDKNLLLAILKNNESLSNHVLSLQLYQNNCSKINSDNPIKQLIKSDNCQEVNIDTFKNIHSGTYTGDLTLSNKENDLLKVMLLESI